MKIKVRKIPFTRIFSHRYGGKWKYDGSTTWHCDDGKRQISRVSSVWYDVNGCDHYGPPKYYLYDDDNPTITADLSPIKESK